MSSTESISTPPEKACTAVFMSAVSDDISISIPVIPLRLKAAVSSADTSIIFSTSMLTGTYFSVSDSAVSRDSFKTSGSFPPSSRSLLI